MTEHGPAHRGGTLGKPGIDWCYVTPGELEQARKNAAAIARVRAALQKRERELSSSLPESLRLAAIRGGTVNVPTGEIWAALGGDPE